MRHVNFRWQIIELNLASVLDWGIRGVDLIHTVWFSSMEILMWGFSVKWGEAKEVEKLGICGIKYYTLVYKKKSATVLYVVNVQQIMWREGIKTLTWHLIQIIIFQSLISQN